MMLLTILGLLALSGSVLCEDNTLRLYNTNEFVDFINSVNSGTSYEGTTVFLESQLDFSDYHGELSPIGIDYDHPFAGVFDGQGYAIGNMKISNSFKGYAGLFGCTKSATIKNIIYSMTNVINPITDSSITSQNGIHIGGIVGYCETTGGYCKVESCVNIANVSFIGKTTGDVYIGGIAGQILSRYSSHIRNCANYGLVASYGSSESIVMGGIIGQYKGTSSKILTANNCINLGATVFNNEGTSAWSVGGLVGHSEYCTYDNCVSGGRVIPLYKMSEGAKTEGNKTGSLCGSFTYTTFKNCYWSESTGNLTLGTDTVECASFNASLTLSKTIKVGDYRGDNVLDVLNAAAEYYTVYEYSKWGYSTGNIGLDFIINGRAKHFDLVKQLFLLPEPSSEGKLSFDGWYSDEDCTVRLTNLTFESDCEVYGRWGENANSYTITLDARGGHASNTEITGQFNSVVKLPEDVTKDDCVFAWWENDYGNQVDWEYGIPAHNITLHAVWECSKIRTANDLIGMAKIVNSGKSYDAATVTLENDVTFTEDESERFEPIGKSSYTSFGGVFDGQGYTVGSLKLRTTFSASGIFGYSKGATVRNVVMDSACSVTSTYGTASSGDDESFFGAFVGYCETFNGNCTIENCVNMGTVSFDGDSSTNIFVGGIAGYLMTVQNLRVNVVNCVNYGVVEHIGKTSAFSDLGGLLGGLNGGSKGAYVFNCMNYGLIRNVGEFKSPCLGGVVGYSIDRASYENCVNFADIISLRKSSGFIGSIAGEIYSNSAIEYCYWNSSAEYDVAGAPDTSVTIRHSSDFDPETFELSEPISFGNYTGRSLNSVINEYVEMNSNMNYSKWALNKNRKVVTFVINNRTTPFLVLDSLIVPVQNITAIGHGLFHGWFVHPNYTKLFNSTEIAEDITLYGFVENIFGPDDPEKLGGTGIAFIFVFLIILAIIIVLVIVGFIMYNKLSYRIKSKRYVQELIEPMLFDKPDNSIDFLNLYPDGYKKVTMKRALINAGVEEGRAEQISSICYRHADNLMETKKLPKGVTVDDAAAIALYTMENEDLDKSPCRIINEALMEGGYDTLKPVKDLLYLVMRALRKMPIVYDKPLYSGVPINSLNKSDSEDDKEENEEEYKNDFGTNSNRGTFSKGINDSNLLNESNMFIRGGESFDEDYLEGEEIMWSALSSTSPNVAVTKAFLAKGSSSDKAEGTLFIIEDGWGYNVQSCSMFPGDTEIVLEPERRFRVKTIIPGEGLTIVKMEMLKTPIVLPKVFGEKKIHII